MSNWQTKKLGELAGYINGYPFKPTDWVSSGLPIIRIQNLNDENKEYHYFSGDIGEKYRVSKGDILISWSASLGTYIWGKDNAWLNQHIFKVIVNENEINKDFFYFLSMTVLEEMKRKTHGGTMKHITKNLFENIQVKVPQLSTQQQIVERLNAIRKLQELKEVEATKTNELFEGLIRNIFTSKNGKRYQISEIAESFQYGLSRRMNSNGDGMPILRINSIEDGNIVDTDLKYVEVNEEELNKYKVQPDDILFNRTNSYELVGKTGIFKLSGIFVFASYLIRLRAKDGILPDYLNYFLNSPMGQAEIRRKAKRAVSQANVNAKELGSISMYVPEKSIQEKAISQLNIVKQHLQTLKREGEKLTEMFESLLHKELHA